MIYTFVVVVKIKKEIELQKKTDESEYKNLVFQERAF